MVRSFKGNLGSSKGLPVQTFAVKIEDKICCLNLKIKTTEEVWLQFMLWGPDEKLKMQHLHLKKESLSSSCTAVNGELLLGEYTLEVFGDFEKNIEYQVIIDDIIQEKLYENLELWSDGNYASKEINLNKYDTIKKISEESRWYAGDCHTHSVLSDGKQTVEQSMASAEKMALDFYFITEHNILPTAWAKGKVLAIPGMEITCQPSHFNALGLTKWIDFRLNTVDGGLSTENGMNRLLEEAGDNGALRSINHPALFPWQWEYKDSLIKNIDTIEIINDPTFQNNKVATEKALKLWNRLWQDGHKIWGIGGSDSHLLPEERYEGSEKPSLIGDPKTWVYSEGLSAKNIITSIRQGRVYVSRGPEMFITIKCEDKEYLPGSDLSEHFSEDKEKELFYSVKFEGLEEDCKLIFIENNQEIICEKITNGKTYYFQFLWMGEKYIWNRIEVRNKTEELIVFTNPVFKGKGRKELTRWGELK